jgi:hypothetical protein
MRSVLYFLSGLFLTSILIGCRGHFPSAYLNGGAMIIAGERDRWDRMERPKNYVLTNVKVPGIITFQYTNVVTLSNNVVPCRFIVQEHSWPPDGYLGITDEGTVIWVWEGDGTVVVSPQLYGLKYQK